MKACLVVFAASVAALVSGACMPLPRSRQLQDSNAGDKGSTAAKNLAAAKAEKANTAAAEQAVASKDTSKAAQSDEAKSAEQAKKAASESAKHWSKALNAKLHENEAKKYHEITASHTKEKQAELQFKEKYAEAAKSFSKSLAKHAQQAAAKAAEAAKAEQAAKKELEAGKFIMHHFDIKCFACVFVITRLADTGELVPLRYAYTMLSLHY
eukprot:4618-Heterococcus_DN1.PRE.4